MFQQFQPSLFPLPPRRRSRAEREVVPQHPRRCGRWAEALTPGHLKLRRDGATHAEHAGVAVVPIGNVLTPGHRTRVGVSVEYALSGLQQRRGKVSAQVGVGLVKLLFSGLDLRLNVLQGW